MKTGASSTQGRQKAGRAFTLTELLLLLAVMTLLAVVVLPALAAIPVKSGRMQCANNLRQIGTESMTYAMENGDVLPVCTIGSVNTGGNSNILQSLTYTRYVYSGSPGILVPTNLSPAATYYQNLGYLYHTGLAGKGQIFYCPDQWGTILGANAYTPLLTSDSSGIVRSSYAYNPRTVDPTNSVLNRKYQKTRDLPPHKLFAVDYFGAASPNLPIHFRERGWNVLFTDGSVQFSQDILAYQMIYNYVDSESASSQMTENGILNQLEQDH